MRSCAAMLIWWHPAVLLLLFRLQGAPLPCGAVRYHGGAVRWEAVRSVDPMNITVKVYASVAINGVRCGLVQTWGCGFACPETHYAVEYSCVSEVPPPRFSPSWGALVPLEAAFTLHMRRDSVSDVRQTSCCWNSDYFEAFGLATPRSDVDFILSTFIDLRTRNDTLQPNSSPKASIAPLVRVGNQCKTRVKIEVSDPDGDTVKCRYARRLECGGGICGTFPRAHFLKDRCEFDFFGHLNEQLPRRFGVTVVVEDFPNAAIEMKGTLRTLEDALSSVTLQFTVQVGSSNDCVRLLFVDPTPAPRALVRSHAGVRLEIPVVVTADGGSTRLAPEIVVVCGHGVTAGAALSAPEAPGTYSATLHVTPSLSAAGDLRWTCFYAQSSEGWQSELRCISITVASGPAGPLHGLRGAPVGSTLRALGFIASVKNSGAINLSLFFNQQFVLTTTTAYIRFHVVDNGALVYKINASDPDLVTQQPGFTLVVSVPPGALVDRSPQCLQLDAGVVQDLLTNPGYRLDSAVHDACDWILPAVSAVRGVVEVRCTHERMMATIPQAAIAGYNASSLRLNVQAASCGLHDEQQAVAFNVSFGSCGTVFEETATDFVFTQMVTLASRTSNLVTYDYLYILVNCTCKIPRRGVLSQGPLQLSVPSLVLNQTAFSILDIIMDFYTNSRFETAFLASDYPLHVSQGDLLLLQVSVRSTLNVLVFTLDCYATPTSSPQDPNKYYLIQDGCLLVDVTNLTSVETLRHFSFKAFSFTSSPDVYIHCAIIACKGSMFSSRCYKGCLPPRAKRSSSVIGETPIYVISRGPVHFDASSQTDGVALGPPLLWTAALATLGLLTLGFVLKLAPCSKRRRHNPLKCGS